MPRILNSNQSPKQPRISKHNKIQYLAQPNSHYVKLTKDGGEEEVEITPGELSQPMGTLLFSFTSCIWWLQCKKKTVCDLVVSFGNM